MPRAASANWITVLALSTRIRNCIQSYTGVNECLLPHAVVHGDWEKPMTETTSAEQPSPVFVVDDQSTGRRILERVILGIDSGIEVETFSDAASALERIRARTPDLIITDYKMPGMDGVTFTKRVREIPACADIPLVMVTVVEDTGVRYSALDAGASDFLSRPIDQYECRARCRNLLTLRKQQKLIRNRARWLEEQVRVATREIREREHETLFRLARAGEFRDSCTGNHILRIARYSRLIAEGLGLSRSECEDIELAAPMHDIGKIGISDTILLKPGTLTESERQVMKRHAEMGYEILRDSLSHRIRLGAIIARHHHERYDGSGYPDGLAGEAIPRAARIVAVCDVFDALTSERPYKRRWAFEDALDYVRAHSATWFDPACVETFLKRAADVRRVHDELRDAAPQFPGDMRIATEAAVPVVKIA